MKVLGGGANGESAQSLPVGTWQNTYDVIRLDVKLPRRTDGPDAS
jgi:hypothetical protein